jgi:hypothetical protein
MMTPRGDRRAHVEEPGQEEAGFWIGRRRYPLSKIGRGIALLGAVGGVVAGCFFGTLNLVGRKLVPDDAEFRRTSVLNDSLSLIQRTHMAVQIDSLKENMRDLQEQVALVGLTSCAQLRGDAPDWLKEKCRDVLRKGGRP